MKRSPAGGPGARSARTSKGLRVPVLGTLLAVLALALTALALLTGQLGDTGDGAAQAERGLMAGTAAPGGTGADRKRSGDSVSAGEPPQGVAQQAGGADSSPTNRSSAAGEHPWRGLVTEESSGRGVAGALISLAFGDLSHETRTDETGHFVLGWYPPAGMAAQGADTGAAAGVEGGAEVGAEVGLDSGPTGRLEILADGFLPLRRYQFQPQPSPVPGGAGDEREVAALFALRPAGSMRGQLTRWGAVETAGVEVLLRRWHKQLAAGEKLGVVDSYTLAHDGLFHFTDLQPGQYSLAAAVPGAGLLYYPGIAVHGGAESWVELEAHAGGNLAGRVVLRGPGQSPVAGACVELRPQLSGAGRDLEQAGQRELTTDELGRFQFEGVQEGPHELLARSPWGVIEQLSVTRESGVGEEVVLRLAPPAALSGSVLDGTGQPLSGAWLRLIAEDAEEYGKHGRWGWPETPLAETDGDGRFVFEELRSGAMYTPIMDGSSGAGAGSEVMIWPPFKLRAGERRDDLVLVLEAGVNIVGSVVGAHAGGIRDLAGARVMLRHGGVPLDEELTEELCDGEGRFVFEGLPRGSVTLRVEAGGFAPREFSYTLPDDGDVLEVTLSLESAWELAGVVVDGDGNAISGGRVVLTSAAGELEQGLLDLGYVVEPERKRSVVLDAWGRFEFDALTAASVSLRALVPQWRQPQELAVQRTPLVPGVAGAPLVSLVMEPEPMEERASLRGRVVMANGDAVLGLVVRGKRGGSLTNNGGDFTVSGMQPGQAVLQFKGQAAVPRKTGELRLAPGSETDLGLIELLPGTDLTVRVLDSDRRRLKRAACTLRPLGAKARELPGRGDHRQVLKRDVSGGEVQLKGLPRGRWLLEVRAPGWAKQELALRLRKGQQTRVVTLEQGD